MSDIVERLRGTADAFELAQAPHHLALYMRVAADEIERLRAGGCARDQTTTKYCGEAAQMATEIERLRAALKTIAKQKKTDELETACDVEYADFEGGYDACIDVARAALHPAPIQGEKGGSDANQG